MPTKEIQYLHISTWTIVRFLGIILGLVFLYFIRDILAIVLFAVIVASSMEPLIRWLAQYKFPRILSVILIYLALVGLATVLFFLIVPVLSDELSGFSSSYSIFERKIIGEVKKIGILPFSSFLTDTIKDFISAPASYLAQTGGGIINFTTSIFGGVFSFLLLIIISFYLAAQEKGIESFLRLVMPLEYEPYIIDLWERSQRKLGRWFRGQLLLGAIVGVLIFLGLTILGVNYALVLAIIAAIFEIIPIVGPILAAVPAVAVSFLQYPQLSLFVIALYFVVQQVESHLIIPIVMQRVVGLSSLMVVLALLIGAKLGGILGILLSVPITTVLVEFINDIDKKKRSIIPE